MIHYREFLFTNFLLVITVSTSVSKHVSPKDIIIDLNNTEKIIMKYIPGGTFWLGGEIINDRRSQQHQVTVSPFYMAETEITNAQFRAFRPNHDSQKLWGYSLNGNDQPVVFVEWDDVKKYCAWLSKKTGYTFRLPSEAEWEFACRAGTSTCRWWGDDFKGTKACRYANAADQTFQKTKKYDTFFRRYLSSFEVFHCQDGFTVTAPAKSFQPNKFGLYDMLGNVYELCEDFYDDDYYDSAPKINPINTTPNSELHRVVRGGSWCSRMVFVQSGSRNFCCTVPTDPYFKDNAHPPSDNCWNNNIGFRPVMIKQ